MYQHFPLQDPLKLNQNWDFWVWKYAIWQPWFRLLLFQCFSTWNLDLAAPVRAKLGRSVIETFLTSSSNELAYIDWAALELRATSQPGWPDEFMPKSTKMKHQPFLSKLIHMYVMFMVEKSSPKFWAIFVIFNKTTLGKQWPSRRKIAQSGHPGLNSNF
jgi:hypothetical protein